MNLEQINQCIMDIINNYKSLTETKDRDLLHYSVFSFKNYHEIITKIDIWTKLPEKIITTYY